MRIELYTYIGRNYKLYHVGITAVSVTCTWGENLDNAGREK